MLFKSAYIQSLLNEYGKTHSKVDAINNIALDIGMRTTVKDAYPNVSADELDDRDTLHKMFWSTISDEDMRKVHTIFPAASAALGAGMGAAVGKGVSRKGKILPMIVGGSIGAGAGYGLGNHYLHKIEQDAHKYRKDSLKTNSGGDIGNVNELK